jgi:hypothetical protein
VLSAYVPDLEIALIEVDQADVLSNGRNGVQSRIVVGVVQALNLLEEGSFAGVVESKEEDGVFWTVNLVS